MREMVIAEIKRIYSEIRTPSVFSLICVYCCYLTMNPMKKEIGNGGLYFLYIVTYISSSQIGKTYNRTREIANKLWKKALIMFVYIYFCVAMYGMAFLEEGTLYEFELSNIVYILFAIIWTFPVFLGFLYVLDLLFTNEHKNVEKHLSFGKKLLLFSLLVINYIIWLYAFNPCISSADSVRLFNQAHQMLDVPMTNWHPPFYTIILSLLLNIYNSPSFIIIIQCLLFAALIVTIIDNMLSWGCDKRNVIIIYCLWGFAFNNTLLMLTLWKDIPYMISLLWLTFLLSQMIIQDYDVSIKWRIELPLAIMGVALFRQNGIVPAFGVCLAVSALAIAKRKYRIIISITAFLILFYLTVGPLYSAFKVEKAPELKYFALANDIVGTYYIVDSFSPEGERMVSIIESEGPEEEYYTPYYTRYGFMSGLSDYSIGEFVSVYFKTFIEHPRALTLQFMRRNTALWSIFEPEKEESQKAGVNYKGDYHEDELKYTYAYRHSNILTEWLGYLTDKLTSNSVIYIFAWRTAIYTVALLLALVYVLANNRIVHTVVFIPAIFNIMTLYVSSGWPDYRYHWPSAVATLYILCHIGFARIKERKNGNTANGMV